MRPGDTASIRKTRVQIRDMGAPLAIRLPESRQVPYPVRRTTASLAAILKISGRVSGCAVLGVVHRPVGRINQRLPVGCLVGYAATPMENDGTIWLPSAMAMQ